MKLSDVIGSKAIHLSGMYFLDAPSVQRRFVVIVADSHEGLGIDADNYSATYHTKKPEDFPEDGWIVINN